MSGLRLKPEVERRQQSLQIIEQLQAHPAVEYAQPNWILHAFVTPQRPKLRHERAMPRALWRGSGERHKVALARATQSPRPRILTFHLSIRANWTLPPPAEVRMCLSFPRKSGTIGAGHSGNRETVTRHPGWSTGHRISGTVFQRPELVLIRLSFTNQAYS
jgi:hypothetical protein